MKPFGTFAAPAFFAALLAGLCSASASAQEGALPPPPREGEIESVAVPPATEDSQPLKKTSIAVKSDKWPAKRNPFWPIGLQKVATAGTDKPKTNDLINVEPTEVNWKEATKYVRDNAKVSKVGTKILVVFEGQVYDIGNLIRVTRYGNVYSFKLTEGAKLEQQEVRPARD